ncbi:hypothetical protein [Mycoplasma sp. 5370]
MKKHKLLKPILALSTVSASVITLISCSDKKEEKNFLYVSQTNLFSTSAEFNFESKNTDLNFDESKYKYKFEYKKEADADFSTLANEDFRVVEGYKNKAIVTLKNLEPETNYLFKFSRATKTGENSYSEFQQVELSTENENKLYAFTTTKTPDISSGDFILTPNKTATSTQVSLTFSKPEQIKDKKVWVVLSEISLGSTGYKQTKEIETKSQFYSDTSKPLTFEFDKLQGQKTYLISDLLVSEQNESDKSKATKLSFESESLIKQLTTTSRLISAQRVASSEVENSDQVKKPFTIASNVTSIENGSTYKLTIREYDRTSGKFKLVKKEGSEQENYVEYTSSVRASENNLNRFLFVFNDIPEKGKSYIIVKFVKVTTDNKEEPLTIFRNANNTIIEDVFIN